MKTKKWWFAVGAVIFFMLVVLAFWVGIFIPVGKHSTQTITFVVQKGEGSREIAYHLETQGLIRSAPLFRIWALTFKFSHKLKAGAYLFSPSMAAARIGKILAQGDIIKEFITIPEGWSIVDIANSLEAQGRFQAEDFLKITKEDFSQKFDFLKDKPSSASLEGYLFPDTYQILRTQTLTDIVEQMLKNFGQHFTQDLKSETAKQKKTIFEVVTMASLLEKEVQTMEDKKMVSGILWKRLQYGIALQVDAAPKTYKRRGLPAEPIANPGLDSILAALRPTQSPYLYYLSAPTGKTIFSKTLEEHNAARTKYLGR